jgi:hypothetical protein
MAANCLIVRAVGSQLDRLRGEASRIARGSKVDWWVERSDTGTRFCFEDAEAKRTFASICERFAVPCLEAGDPHLSELRPANGGDAPGSSA